MKILESSRLYLRQMIPDDEQFIIDLHTDPEVMKHIGRVRSPKESRDRLSRIIKDYARTPGLGIWMACLRDNDKQIGWGCLKDLDGSSHIEIGYRLAVKFWNLGYATEISKSLIHYGFKHLELTTIAGVTSPGNIASRKVLEKSGLTFRRMAHFYNTDVLFFDLEKAQWSGYGGAPDLG